LSSFFDRSQISAVLLRFGTRILDEQIKTAHEYALLEIAIEVLSIPPPNPPSPPKTLHRQNAVFCATGTVQRFYKNIVTALSAEHSVSRQQDKQEQVDSVIG